MKARILSLLPDEPAALARLWLNATDAARVCGVTVRQLTYWTDKGIIPSSSHDGRSYDVAALNKVVAIKRLMLTGLTLEKAALAMAEAAEAPTGPAVLTAGTRSAYVDGLIGVLEECRRNLPAYLALANLRRTADALATVGLDGLLARGGLPVEYVTARLNTAAFTLERLLDDLHAPVPVEASAAVDQVGQALGTGGGVLGAGQIGPQFTKEQGQGAVAMAHQGEHRVGQRAHEA
ncbi:MAG: MerR family transcriptional regulator [Chloroflexota bacterium]